MSASMSRLSDRRQARRDADLAGKAAPDLELEAALAMQRTTRRLGAAIGHEIGRDSKTIEDWGNVHSGNRGPHLTLLYLTQLALEFRPERERAEAFAALDFVEQQLGRLVIDRERCTERDDHGSLAHRIARALVEFAQFVDAIDDGELTASQRLRAHQELQDVVSSCQLLLDDFATGGEAGPVRATRRAV